MGFGTGNLQRKSWQRFPARFCLQKAVENAHRVCISYCNVIMACTRKLYSAKLNCVALLLSYCPTMCMCACTTGRGPRALPIVLLFSVIQACTWLILRSVIGASSCLKNIAFLPFCFSWKLIICQDRFGTHVMKTDQGAVCPRRLRVRPHGPRCENAHLLFSHGKRPLFCQDRLGTKHTRKAHNQTDFFSFSGHALCQPHCAAGCEDIFSESACGLQSTCRWVAAAVVDGQAAAGGGGGDGGAVAASVCAEDRGEGWIQWAVRNTKPFPAL
jgi:hypothetical protein